MNNDEPSVQHEVNELTVGQLLREAREQRQLTLAQVAKQLNLKVDILQSIEADLPDKTILPTFIRGYLRSYARFLKIPEQDLLSRFEQVHAVKSAPVKTMKTFSNRQAKQQSEARYLWLTYFIIAALLVSLAIWLWQGARDFSPFNSGFSVSEAPATVIDITPEAESVFETTLPPVAEVQAEVQDEQALTDIPVPEVAQAAEPTVSAAPLSQAVLLPESPESFGDVNDNNLDRLKMTFSDDCWIDVLDGNGERIAFGTKQGGYVMELNAKGPFTITLGNPGVVSITINQKPFDTSGFPGGRVAKFTLAGQDE